MSFRAAMLADIPARVFRLSFSGEVSYEVNVAADHGDAAWRALLHAGYDFGITPYGTEAMGVLRIEKGHVAGNELDGRTTPDDLGLGRMVKTDRDFIGRRALSRPLLTAPDRKQLVGVLPIDGNSAIPRGAALLTDIDRAAPLPIDGHVTSTCYSPTLGQPVALGLLKGGRARHGELVWAYAPVADVKLPVRIVDPVFIDPAGERVRG
jgi:sarcosine oxidase subunit alpha